MRLARIVVLFGVLLCAAVPAAAQAAPGPLGSLTQLAGTSGCLTSAGLAGQCINMRGGQDTTDVVLSPDGHFAYVAGYGDVAPPVLSILARNPTTGALVPIPGTSGCFSDDGSSEDGPGTCTPGRLIDSGDGHSLAMSADGRFLYASSQSPEGVATFSRNASTGLLTQLAGNAGCVSVDGSSDNGPGTCADGRALEGGVASVTITPDGAYLYASAYPDRPNSPGDDIPGIAIFARNASTGVLTQLAGTDGCTTFDGSDVDGAGQCNIAPSLDQPFETVTPDNKFVYAANRVDDLVGALRRNSTGGLVPLAGTAACISDTGDSLAGPGTCVKGRGLNDAERIVASPDGRFLYTQGYGPADIAVLARNATTGALSQSAATSACATFNGASVDGPATCVDARNLSNGYAGAISPDGRTLYYSNDSTQGGLAIFRVDPATGALAQLAGTLGCFSEDGSSTDDGAGTCTAARAVSKGYGVTVAPNGRDVYFSSSNNTEGGVAVFHAEVAPTCSGAAVAIAHETATSVALSCVDLNGDAVTRSIVRGPAHGTLSGSAASGAVTYTPAAGYHGPDSIAFAATDGVAGSGVATTSLNVGAIQCAKPKVSRTAKRKTVLKSGLKLTLACTTPFSSSAKVTVSSAVKRKLHLRSRTLATKKGSRKAGTVKLTVKLSKSAAKRLKKVHRTRKLKSFRATLAITLSDQAGRVSKSSVKLTVKL